MVEIIVPRIENVEKVVENGKINDVMGIKSNNSMRAYIQSKINHFMKYPNTMYSGKEVEMILTGFMQAYDFFETKPIIGRVEIDTWHGKSGIIKLIKKPDRIIAYKMQKLFKGAEPKEINYIITKQQFNALILAINRCKSELIDTREIAENWCKLIYLNKTKKGMPLFWDNGEFIWENFFSYRRYHCLLTIGLGILSCKKIIEYVGGKTKVLSRDYNFDKLDDIENNEKEVKNGRRI